MGLIGSTKRRILESLKRNQKHGYELAKELGLPLSSVYEHLAELRVHNLIEYEERSRKKIYHLTEKGELLLKVLK